MCLFLSTTKHFIKRNQELKILSSEVFEQISIINLFISFVGCAKCQKKKTCNVKVISGDRNIHSIVNCMFNVWDEI